MYVYSCNNKSLGIYYLYSSGLFGLSGTIGSMFLRFELYSSGHRIMASENQNFYNLTFTLHGLLMIFFLVMPGLYGGFGNYFIPIVIGAPEVAFPRINSLSFILLLVSYGLMIMAMISEFPGGGGWTLYPPLSTSLMSLSPVTIDLIINGLLINGISSFFSSLNFVGTISNMRLSGFIFLSLFSCGILITAFLLLLTLPILTGALGMLLGDLHFNTVYFDFGFGGDPVLYQHFFWFFGHPEVYILIIPAFGIISQVISNISEKIIFGIQSMILAMSCISILGSIVWGHHIYTLGLEVDTRGYFMTITIMISLPTGTKIFNWLSTILGCYYIIIIFSYMIFIIIFIIMFTLGGSTGVVLGNAAVDVTLHDTYYVIAHFHYILSLGAIIAFLLGLLYYQNILFSSYSMLGSSTSRNARFHGLLSFFGIHLTFTPMHFLGFNVQPRRIPDFPDYINIYNNIITNSSISLILYILIINNHTVLK